MKNLAARAGRSVKEPEERKKGGEASTLLYRLCGEENKRGPSAAIPLQKKKEKKRSS